jgi:hypothetical protein
MTARVTPFAARLRTLCLDGFASFVATFRLGLGDSFPLPFEHHLSLELCDGAHYRQHQLSGRCLGVHSEIEDADAHTLALQCLKIAIRSGTERASRSSLATTKMSPSRTYSMAA